MHIMYYETEASKGSGTFLNDIFRRTRLCHASTLAAATAAGSSFSFLSCSAAAVMAAETAVTTAAAVAAAATTAAAADRLPGRRITKMGLRLQPHSCCRKTKPFPIHRQLSNVRRWFGDMPTVYAVLKGGYPCFKSSY